MDGCGDWFAVLKARMSPGENAAGSEADSVLARSGPPERIAVVVNGNAKNVTAEVISTLDQILLGGDLFVSRSLGEADEIAKVVISRGYRADAAVHAGDAGAAPVWDTWSCGAITFRANPTGLTAEAFRTGERVVVRRPGGVAAPPVLRE